MNRFPGGGEATGKAALRDMINATIGYEQFAAELQKSSQSIHRMPGPAGYPGTASFFATPKALQKRVGVKLTVQAS